MSEDELLQAATHQSHHIKHQPLIILLSMYQSSDCETEAPRTPEKRTAEANLVQEETYTKAKRARKVLKAEKRFLTKRLKEIEEVLRAYESDDTEDVPRFWVCSSDIKLM